MVALLVFLASAVEAQQTHRLYRIGVLNEAWAANHPAVEGLKAGLRDLGFHEGRDVTFDIRFTKGDPKAMPVEAKALVKAGVDLIFTSKETATLAAMAETQKLPIVFTLVGDPVTAGVVKELVHPGGNLTGISSLTAELTPKRLEVLKTFYPGVKRVWYIYDATNPTGLAALSLALLAAPRLGVELESVGVATAPEVTAVLDSLKPGDALLAPDQDGFDINASILEKSLAAHIPVVFASSLLVAHGGLVSYGPDYYAQGVQAARLVAKILRGTRPADLPVESTDRLYLSVNLTTASLFRLPVPPKILYRANVVHR